MRKITFILVLTLTLIFETKINNVLAQDSASVLYVPLVGITSVPQPLALPKGAGRVRYNYAVKNFLQEVALTNVAVTDNKCSSIAFVEGDDNRDFKLDYSETWRYSCTTSLFETTQSVATVTATFNSLVATHKAYATVVVGSDNPAPLVSIINITKVAHPLSLPEDGGEITFTYRVNNPGIVPLSKVVVADNKCKAMSGKLGDTNGNNLLDISEVWTYTCTASLSRTTTNTANVTAFANGLKAIGEATITVEVDAPNSKSIPGFPQTGFNFDFKTLVWLILAGILATLIAVYILRRK